MKLYCEDNQTCEIECHDYGCYNVSSMNGNGNYNIDCTNNKVSNILCNVSQDYISMTALNDLPSSITHIGHGFENIDTLSLCTNSSVLGINCGDDQECQNSSLSYINKAICCTGHYGCEDSSATFNVNFNSSIVSMINRI